MPLNAFTSNQGTQTAILTDNTGGTGGTVIAVQKVDISGQGTAGTLWNGGVMATVNNGSIVVTASTISSMPNIPGGTFNLGTITGNLGTIGALGLLANGTLANSGTTTGVGSVSNIGSLGMLNAGTLTTIPNIPGGSIVVTTGTIPTLGTMGTLGLLTSGTLLNSGTTTGVGTITNLGSVTNLGQLYNAGTVQNQLAGTLTALQNGTINNGSIVQTAGTVNAGTMNTGTLNTGTLSPIPTIANVTYGTHGTTGVSIFGTLAGGTGSGAGTEIFITSLSLSIPSTGGSQDVSIGWGSNAGTFHAGTGLLVRGNYPQGGGIQKPFWPPVNSGTNGQLMVFQAERATVDVSVTYFITPSSL